MGGILPEMKGQAALGGGGPNDLIVPNTENTIQ